MQAVIKKPSERKQEMIGKFFWLRTYLLAADRLEGAGAGAGPGPGLKKLDLAPKKVQKLIETVWNAQTTYTQADDDEYNYNIALETYQMLENGLMFAGIDIDAGIRTVMERNGYRGFSQLKPTKTPREIPDDFFEIDEPKPAGIGSSRDPWN